MQRSGMEGTPINGRVARAPRMFSVEEELLLVDVRTGNAVPQAAAVMERYRLADAAAPGPVLATKPQQEMIAVVTAPHSTMEALEADIVAGRTMADRAAQEVGVRVAALGTSPLSRESRPARRLCSVPSLDIAGPATGEHLTCGSHIQVSVESAEEAVAVLDRIRIWLPVLIALSANSPFWQGQDTGFASYRTRVWSRWPATGPLEILGTPAAYRRLVQDMVSAGVVLDEDRVYFDARISRYYPAVEIRLADVCLLPENAVLLAALARGLVETAAREWRDGVPPAPVRSAVLKVAGWKASRWGLRGDLLDPRTHKPAPAVAVVNTLVNHIREALQDNGDLDRVEELIDDLLHDGTAAARQLRVLRRTGGLDHVVIDAVNCTVWAPRSPKASALGDTRRMLASGFLPAADPLCSPPDQGETVRQLEVNPP